MVDVPLRFPPFRRGLAAFRGGARASRTARAQCSAQYGLFRAAGAPQKKK